MIVLLRQGLHCTIVLCCVRYSQYYCCRLYLYCHSTRVRDTGMSHWKKEPGTQIRTVTVPPACPCRTKKRIQHQSITLLLHKMMQTCAAEGYHSHCVHPHVKGRHEDAHRHEKTIVLCCRRAGAAPRTHSDCCCASTT